MSNEIKYNAGERAIIYGVSSLIGMVVGFLCLLLAAALMLASDLQEGYASPISAVAMGIGSLSAGFFASLKIKKGGIVNGTVCGAMIYAVIMFMSLFLSDGGFSLITVYHLLIVILSAAVGGILGVASASKKRY